jgi:hypothetical protein
VARENKNSERLNSLAEQFIIGVASGVIAGIIIG